MGRLNPTPLLIQKRRVSGDPIPQRQEMEVQTDPVLKTSLKRSSSDKSRVVVKRDSYNLRRDPEVNKKEIAAHNFNTSQQKKIRGFKDEYEAFGESIASQLRSVKDQYTIAAAKFNIQKILFEAETGVYMPNQRKRNRSLKRIPGGQTLNTSDDLAKAITEGLRKIRGRKSLAYAKIYLQRVVFKAEAGLYNFPKPTSSKKAK